MRRPSPGSATDLSVAGRSFWNVKKRDRPPDGEGDQSSTQKGTLVAETTTKSISLLLTVHFITKSFVRTDVMYVLDYVTIG